LFWKRKTKPIESSKAARNEQRKLRASWFNAVSVGTFLGGFLLPYYEILRKISDRIGPDASALEFTREFKFYFAYYAALFFAIICASFFALIMAHRAAAKIED
jgi:hypothetical protein